MHTIYLILTIFALASLAAGLVSAIVLTDYVSKRGIKINSRLQRIKSSQYVQDYKRLSLQEKGKNGGWYYTLTSGMTVMLILGLTLLLLKGILRFG
ncbi:MAG: hypothetical protein QHH43_02760 [Candidatus Saccharicenans sp.]|jgi:hypothetical protein|nr:hypothetical protein [Candidatus Saccharicenans sp.]MDH7574665.1 hypothetical protein [Candidatus Saccharicenans sp.]